MEIRISIIQKVTETLIGKADEETISLVQDVLTMQLSKYELQERRQESNPVFCR